MSAFSGIWNTYNSSIITSDGFLRFLIKNLDKKVFSDVRLRVYKSIFRKFSTLLLGTETTLMGETKYQEFIFEHENSWKWTIKGLCVDFVKNVNFNHRAWNCIFGVFEVSGTQFWQWKFDSMQYWGSTSRFSKNVNFIPWPCDCIFWAPVLSGTHLWASKFIRTDHWGSIRRLCKKY